MVDDQIIIDAHVAIGQEHHLRATVNDVVAEMDRNGVNLAIARAMGAELAVHHREGNARVLRASPRIRGLATVSPWAREAREELKRSREMGAVGLYLHPTRQGFMATDDVAEAVVEFAAQAGWPIVFHTGTYLHSDVLAVAEVARRYPKTTFVCDSAGFSDMWFELPGLMTENANLMLCTSLIWTRAILNTINAHGPERVMFGSGFPRDAMGAALARIRRLELPPATLDAVLRGNAARVFGLRR